MAESRYIGKIIGIHGQVVEVEFLENQPNIFEMLTVTEARDSLLEVIYSASETTFFCLALHSSNNLARGMEVVTAGKQLRVPAGVEVLGRVMDIFGKSHDGLGEIKSKDKIDIHKSKVMILDEVKTPIEIMETGIKAIDFFAPILKGGKVGLFGGAGVGKTILLTELINNMLTRTTQAVDTFAIYSAVGERSREAQELYHTLRKTPAFRKLCLVLGQMGENPAVRTRTAIASVALTGYFRDQLKKNVLFLMDNAYRFAQAGHELSIMTNSIPSEDGYQPTLTSEMGTLHERLNSSIDSFVTAIEAIFVPSDDMTDFGVRSIFPFLDTFVILSRTIYQEGRLPAIDLVESSSTAINPMTISSRHYSVYLDAKSLLQESVDLEKIVSLVGFGELSYDDQVTYNRAQILKNYMTQSFFTTKLQTGRIGQYVPLAQTVVDVGDILNGKYDKVDPEKFRFLGAISKQ